MKLSPRQTVALVVSGFSAVALLVVGIFFWVLYSDSKKVSSKNDTEKSFNQEGPSVNETPDPSFEEPKPPGGSALTCRSTTKNKKEEVSITHVKVTENQNSGVPEGKTGPQIESTLLSSSTVSDPKQWGGKPAGSEITQSTSTEIILNPSQNIIQTGSKELKPQTSSDEKTNISAEAEKVRRQQLIQTYQTTTLTRSNSLKKPARVPKEHWDAWHSRNFSIIGCPEVLPILLDESNGSSEWKDAMQEASFYHLDIEEMAAKKKDKKMSEVASANGAILFFVKDIAYLILDASPKVQKAFKDFLANPEVEEAKAFSASVVEHFTERSKIEIIHNAFASTTIGLDSQFGKSIEALKHYFVFLLEDKRCSQEFPSIATIFSSTLNTLEGYSQAYQNCKSVHDSDAICEHYIETLFRRAEAANELSKIEGKESEIGKTFSSIFFPLMCRLLALKKLKKESSASALGQKLKEFSEIPFAELPTRIKQTFEEKGKIEQTYLNLEKFREMAKALSNGECKLELDCSLTCPTSNEAILAQFHKKSSSETFRTHFCDPFKVDGLSMDKIIENFNAKLANAKALMEKDGKFFQAINPFTGINQ